MPSHALARDQGTPNDSAAEDFDKILYHVTHDVRAALRAMMALPDWIREDLEKASANVPKSVFEDLALLQSQTARADRFLVDLRTYGRAAKPNVAPVRIDLADLVSEAVLRQDVSSRFRVETKLAVTHLKGPTADLALLADVLISNAAKHHDRDHGRILIESALDGGNIKLSVADDGPGIETRFRETVFELMSTLKSRDDCESSGVGLAIARKIVNAMGGEIRIVDSLWRRGTRVEITIPGSFKALN